MNKELYTHFIYLSCFYKTTELKISSSNNLEVNEISIFGSFHKKINLSDTILKTKNKRFDRKVYLTVLFVLLSTICLLSFSQILTNYKPELMISLIGFSAILLSLVFISEIFHSKERYTLNSLSNNEVLYSFKLDQDLSSANEELNDFIVALNEGISNKVEESLENYVDIATNYKSTEEQYNALLYHLECLYNSSVIDDTTFDRIDSNINEKLYPNNQHEARPIADVIYLNNGKFAHSK